jgi:hypothetical protein
MTGILLGVVAGYLLRWFLHEKTLARCPRVRYGSQGRRQKGHLGPHKAWIDWSMSPTRIGHTEHWHDEVELN